MDLGYEGRRARPRAVWPKKERQLFVKIALFCVLDPYVSLDHPLERNPSLNNHDPLRRNSPRPSVGWGDRVGQGPMLPDRIARELALRYWMGVLNLVELP